MDQVRSGLTSRRYRGALIQIAACRSMTRDAEPRESWIARVSRVIKMMAHGQDVVPAPLALAGTTHRHPL